MMIIVTMIMLLLSSCVRGGEEITLIPPINLYPTQAELIEGNNFYARWTKSAEDEDSHITYTLSYARTIDNLDESFGYETQHNYFLFPHLEYGAWYWRVRATDSQGQSVR